MISPFVGATGLRLFLDKRPLLVALDGLGSQVLDLLMVEAWSMATTGFEQASNGGLGPLGQPRGGADAAPFGEMVDDFFGFGFTDLGMEQGRVSSFRERFTTRATAQQTKGVFAIDLPNRKIALSGAPNRVACGIDTG